MCLIAKYVLVFHLTCKIRDNICREGYRLLNQLVTFINPTLRVPHKTWHIELSMCLSWGFSEEDSK